MISVLFFSYSETLKIILVEYAATEMGYLDDYSDAAPKGKALGKMVLVHFFCTLPNLQFSIKQIALKQHLFPMHR